MRLVLPLFSAVGLSMAGGTAFFATVEPEFVTKVSSLYLMVALAITGVIASGITVWVMRKLD